MKRILSLLVLFVFFLPLVINAEQDLCAACPQPECPACPGEEEDQGPWTNNLAIGYSKTDGNSDTSLLNIKFGSVYDNQDDDLVRMEFEHSFGDQDDETNIDYSRALAEYQHILTERFYTAMGTGFMRDEIADVKYRVTVNPALGYYLYKKNEDFFTLEAGPSYLFEEVAGVDDDYFSPRIGNRLEYELSDTAKLYEYTNVFFSVDDGDNYIIQAEAGLITKIVGDWNIIFSVRDNYDNQPAAGNEKNDLALLTSIGVDF